VLGDSGGGAACLTKMGVALLSVDQMEKPFTPKVAWVSTWNVRCGIASYSRYLLNSYPDAARDVTVLCDERSQATDLDSQDGPAARITWRLNDPSTADQIARAIVATDSSVVVVQHHPTLIKWDMLTALLLDRRVACREILITLHDVVDLQAWPDRERVLEGFDRVSRILVHNLRDLLMLRSWRVLENIALFPHGAMRPSIARRLTREFSGVASPVIGTYGFLLPNKGIDVLIRAFALVSNDWPAARLRVVTAKYPHADSVAEMARCRALARSFGLEGAIEWHTGYMSDGDSLTLLNGCDLLVLPRRVATDSASGSARVAMASGVPVLVTPIEIFQELGSAVIRAGGADAQAVAASIADALRNHKLRQQTVEKANRWLAAHDWSLMSMRLHGLICGLVANRDAFVPPEETSKRLTLPNETLRPESRIATTRHSWGATGEAVSRLGPEGEQGHPPSGTVSVVVASYGREVILERTLDSFFEFNTYPIDEFIVIRYSEVAKNASLAQKYHRYHLKWKTAHIDISSENLNAITYSETKMTSGYLFYCVDDWEFTRSGFIEKLLWFFQHNHELTQVLLPERSQSDNYPIWDHSFYAGEVPYRLVRDDSNMMRTIRSFHFEPGLKRLEAYSTLMLLGASKHGWRGLDAKASDARNAWRILTAIPEDDESKGYIRRVAP